MLESFSSVHVSSNAHTPVIWGDIKQIARHKVSKNLTLMNKNSLLTESFPIPSPSNPGAKVVCRLMFIYLYKKEVEEDNTSIHSLLIS